MFNDTPARKTDRLLGVRKGVCISMHALIHTHIYRHVRNIHFIDCVCVCVCASGSACMYLFVNAVFRFKVKVPELAAIIALFFK